MKSIIPKELHQPSCKIKPIKPPKKFDKKAVIELQVQIEAEISQNNIACQRQAIQYLS